LRDYIEPIYKSFRNVGAEERISQKEMTYILYDNFAKKSHSFIEAPTGTGKARAILIAASLWSLKNERPVAVSTATKILQDQMFNKDFPVVERHIEKTIGKSPSIAVLKGKSNYISKARYYDHIEYALGKDGDDPDVKNITDWVEETKVGDISEITLPDFVPESAVCVKNGSTDSMECFYQNAIKRASTANIIITNHHSMVSRFFEFSKEDRIQAFETLNVRDIVFDEAHEIEKIALSIFSKKLSLLEMRIAIKSLVNFSIKNNICTTLKKTDKNSFISSLMADVDEITRWMQLLANKRNGEPITIIGKDKDINSVLKMAKRVVKNSLDFADRLNASLTRKGMSNSFIKESINELNGFTEKIKSINSGMELSGNIVHLHFSDVLSYPSVILANSKYTAVLSNKWKKFDSLSFTSATITVPSVRSSDTWAFFSKGIGTAESRFFKPPKHIYKSLPSPFDFGDVKVFLPDKDIPYPKLDKGDDYAKYVDYAAAMVEDACKKDKDGGIMVLCTSYSEIEVFNARLLSGDYDLHGRYILCMTRRANRSDLRESYIQSPKKTVFLATGMFWTGADFPGNLLTSLIIPRLPFEAHNDPCAIVKKMALADKKNEFAYVTLPAAVMRFKQGVGRLVRTKDDYGKIYIADSRIYRNTQFLLVLDHIKNQKVFSIKK
jgi:ATP-dependent DNA helicase DinG